MPRVAGQIDLKKSEAILASAAVLFAEKGIGVTMSEIARHAGVSKQTLYNRYPSKLEIGRALANRRSDAITAPLRAAGDPETLLTAFAHALLDKVCNPSKGESMRGVFLLAPTAPDIASAIFDAGPGDSLRRLSAWLAEQDRQGLLSVPDPDVAAEMFIGMTLGHSHLRTALGIPHPAGDHAARARETAQRFIRAFAP